MRCDGCAADLAGEGKAVRCRVLRNLRRKHSLVDVEADPDGDRADLSVFHAHLRQDPAKFSVGAPIHGHDNVIGPFDTKPASGTGLFRHRGSNIQRGLIDRQGHNNSEHGGHFRRQVRFEQDTHVDIAVFRGKPCPAAPAFAGALVGGDDKGSVGISFRGKNENVVVCRSRLLFVNKRPSCPLCREPRGDLFPVQNIRFLYGKKAVAFIGHRLDRISFFFQFVDIFPHGCAGDAEHLTQLLAGDKPVSLAQPTQYFLFSVQ